MKQTNAFEDLFGRGAKYFGILVAGRRQTLLAGEQKRLNWRSDKVLVDSRQILCLTYDDLYDNLDDAWNRYDPGYYARP